MNILIYIPQLDQSWGGVRQYAVGLIKELALADDNTSFIVYHNQNDPEILSLIETNKQLKLVNDSSVEYIPQTYPGIAKRSVNFLRRRLNLPVKQVVNKTHIELLCAKYKVDIIHCPYQFIPLVSNVKLITTLHDVQELHFPEFFTPVDRAARANRFLDYLTRADKIIVSYKHVEADLIKYFTVDVNKIEIILLNMGKLWFEKFVETDLCNLKEYNLPDRFLLYPANTWKHKNHIRLIEAVDLVKEKNNIRINIICTGHKNEAFHSEVEDKIRALGLEEQVRFLGVVDEKTLFSLYKVTLGVIVPTIYEAGSFPVVESIFLKVPIVCSNVTSLPETVNNEQCLFNPLDVNDIASKMLELWTSQDFRNKTISNNNYSRHLLCNTHALEKLSNLYNKLQN